MKEFDTCVIGAGIAGLVSAYELKKAGAHVVVLEPSSRAGGALKSVKTQGFLLEHGPNTVLPKQDLLDLAESLGLQDRLIFSKANLSRFIQIKGALKKAPLSAISAKGIIRAFAEPFVPKRRDDKEEDIWSFSCRRWGREVADRLVAPFISGIWAGDAKMISVRSAFPKLRDLEKKYQSVILGLLLSKNEKKAPHKKRKGLVSFNDGMETLVDALVQKLSPSLKLNTTVTEIQTRKNVTENLFFIQSNSEPFFARTLILAQPAWAAGPIIKKMALEAAAGLETIPYASLHVIHFGFKRIDVDHDLSGFGYLVPPHEKSPILGCLWSSSIFPDRAPKDSVLLTIFMGGASHEALLNNSESEVQSLAYSAVAPVLGLKDKPYFKSITTYRNAIPQYNIGHEQKINAVKNAEKSYPGLFFAGNYLEGISVNDVIIQAKKTAIQVQKSLRL